MFHRRHDCLYTAFTPAVHFLHDKAEKIDRSYAQKRNLTSDENDDRNWIGGILYYNPSDPHTMVEQRVGIGTTVNMATSLGKGLTIFSAIMMLSCLCYAFG